MEQGPTSKSTVSLWRRPAVIALICSLLGSILGGSLVWWFAARAEQTQVVLSQESRVATSTVVVGEPRLGTSVVRVFYGTNRKFDSRVGTYTGERGVPALGVVDVSVPDDHRVGNIERPAWYLAHFVALDPRKHMVLLKQEPLNSAAFFAQIRSAMQAGAVGSSSAFIFVHGYRVTFEDAALRTAQMAVDLGLPSVPAFYTWPSQGKLAEYTVDDGNADWSEPHLTAFLEQFADKSSASNIYVLAHSMGTRATTKALLALFANRKDLAPRFKELILAAPDIDADVFKRDIAPRLTALHRQITLYASSNDKALGASRFARGGYPRAGESGEGLVLAPGVETVDASMIDTDFLGHSYYGDARSLVTDIALVMGKSMRAAERPGLMSLKLGSEAYWAFKP